MEIIGFIMIGLMLAVVTYQNHQLLKNGDKLMATLADVNAALDKVASGVDALETQIADLKAKVAAGSTVSQADLDALSNRVSAISNDISDTSDQG